MSLFCNYLLADPVFTELCSSFQRAEGNLLEQNNPLTIEAQVETLRLAIAKTAPKVVLEIGTNKGLFGFLLSRASNAIKLYTFDIDDRSAIAVRILKERTGIDVVFQCGDSEVLLPKFNPEEQIDLAWVDGGHTLRTALSDLSQCARLGVRTIAMDDCNYGEVNAARLKFMEEFKYKELESPFAGFDERQARILVRSSEGS